MNEITIKANIPAEALPPIFNIMGKQLTPKYYRGQPIVTFKDVDYLHERPEGTARRNFRKNRKRFIEGEDFIELNHANEIRRVGITRPQGGTPASIILLTETGYLMLVKSFTDNLAWDVQRILIKSYFGFKALWQQQQLERLADMQRRGLLVEYPATPGTWIYCIYDRYDKPTIYRDIVYTVENDSRGQFLFCRATYKGNKSSDRRIYRNEFGTTTFITQQEAEAAAIAMCGVARYGARPEREEGENNEHG